MPTLLWPDTLALGLPEMDTTHHEFEELLARVMAAPDDVLLPLWRALVAHTDDHFARAGHGRCSGAAPASCWLRPGHRRAELAASPARTKRSRLRQFKLLKQRNSARTRCCRLKTIRQSSSAAYTKSRNSMR